ncbi:CRISPR-associated endonuclease Cas2 [Rhodococcus sp. 14-2483-1-2]|nr:CRISPR-associated endonuclease Cas2 [Rhodococcus sp. 14-2483-1-2]
MALTVIACYDISNDDRRAKVAARLQRWGDRIQYSVFLCTIAAEELAALVEAVTAIIDPDIDSFFVARQCGTCWNGRIMVGQSQPTPAPLFWAAF